MHIVSLLVYAWKWSIGRNSVSFPLVKLRHNLKIKYCVLCHKNVNATSAMDKASLFLGSSVVLTGTELAALL